MNQIKTIENISKYLVKSIAIQSDSTLENSFKKTMQNKIDSEWAIVKECTYKSHAYLIHLHSQQQLLQLSSPSVFSLSKENFSQLGEFLDQASFVLWRQKNYDTLSSNIRLELLNKLNSLIVQTNELNKIQAEKYSIPSISYSEFLQQENQGSFRKQNLIQKLFMKYKIIQTLRKEEEIKVKKILPDVPDFEDFTSNNVDFNIKIEEDIQTLTELNDIFTNKPQTKDLISSSDSLKFISQSNAKVCDIQESQCSSRNQNSFQSQSFNSITNSTATSDQPFHSLTANYRFVTPLTKFNAIQTISSCPLQIVQKEDIGKKPSAISAQNNLVKKSIKEQPSPEPCMKKSWKMRFERFEECILNILSKLKMENDCHKEVFDMTMKIVNFLIQDAIYFRKKELFIVCGALIIHSCETINRVINARSLTRVFPNSEKQIHRAYRKLQSSLNKFIQTNSEELISSSIENRINPVEKIKQIIQSLKCDAIQPQILSASQYLFSSLALNGLLNGQSTSIIATVVVFIASVSNGFTYSLKEFTHYSQEDSFSFSQCIQLILSNSSKLLNNSSLFKNTIKF